MWLEPCHKKIPILFRTFLRKETRCPSGCGAVARGHPGGRCPSQRKLRARAEPSPRAQAEKEHREGTGLPSTHIGRPPSPPAGCPALTGGYTPSFIDVGPTHVACLSQWSASRGDVCPFWVEVGLTSALLSPGPQGSGWSLDRPAGSRSQEDVEQTPTNPPRTCHKSGKYILFT